MNSADSPVAQTLRERARAGTRAGRKTGQKEAAAFVRRIRRLRAGESVPHARVAPRQRRGGAAEDSQGDRAQSSGEHARLPASPLGGDAQDRVGDAARSFGGRMFRGDAVDTILVLPGEAEGDEAAP